MWERVCCVQREWDTFISFSLSFSSSDSHSLWPNIASVFSRIRVFNWTWTWTWCFQFKICRMDLLIEFICGMAHEPGWASRSTFRLAQAIAAPVGRSVRNHHTPLCVYTLNTFICEIKPVAIIFVFILLFWRALISVRRTCTSGRVCSVPSRAAKSPEVIYFDDFQFNFANRHNISFFYIFAFAFLCGSDGTFVAVVPVPTKAKRPQLKHLKRKRIFFFFIISEDLQLHLIKMLRLWVHRTRLKRIKSLSCFVDVVGNEYTRKLNSFGPHGRVCSLATSTIWN